MTVEHAKAAGVEMRLAADVSDFDLDARSLVVKRLSCDGVLIFAGMKPNLEPFPERFDLDRFGYLKLDDEMRTIIPNVFAAGDIVSKRYRQMTTAVSDGIVAAIVAARELSA